MLGCEGWETTRATLAFATFPTKLLELRFEIPEPFETTSNPEIARPVKVPTEVMLGCEGCVTTRAVLALATFPTKLLELRFEIPDPSEAMSNPLIVNPDKVPTLVMFG
jgi:hypothetical protein